MQSVRKCDVGLTYHGVNSTLNLVGGHTMVTHVYVQVLYTVVRKER